MFKSKVDSGKDKEIMFPFLTDVHGSLSLQAIVVVG